MRSGILVVFRDEIKGLDGTWESEDNILFILKIVQPKRAVYWAVTTASASQQLHVRAASEKSVF